MCLHIYLRLSFRPKSQKELPKNILYKYIENKHNQKKNKEKSLVPKCDYNSCKLFLVKIYHSTHLQTELEQKYCTAVKEWDKKTKK